MLKLNRSNVAASLLALAATLALFGSAEAACTATLVGSTITGDATGNTCVGTDALLNNVTTGYEIGSSNTAIGMNALKANINGDGNTASGALALESNTDGNFNTASGFRALFSNTNGDYNIAAGSYSLQYNITGNGNTASGYEALNGNISGDGNTASGTGTLRYSTGSYNTAVGYRAGESIWTSNGNIILGAMAGTSTLGDGNIVIGNVGGAGDSATIRIGTRYNHKRTFIAGISGVTVPGGQPVVVDLDGQLGIAPATPGANNVLIGSGAMISNQADGNNNMAIGVNALQLNTVGDNNSASGFRALNKNSTGSANTASGVSALEKNTIGNNNTAIGVNALLSNTKGSNNTAMGAGAMAAHTTGNWNTAIGFEAGKNWTTGENNIAIGNVGVAGESDTIRIGGTQTRTFIAGVRDIKVLKGQAVMVDINGQIGTSKSSIRYKEDVHTMGDASSPLMNLRPVTFRYKEAAPDGSKPIQYGLIAEEVEEVMPDLVIYNAQGTPESVAYETLPSLLLNEYQKQGRALAAAEAKLVATEAEFAETRAELGETQAKLEAMDAELAALKLAVSRLAAAPAAVKLAGSQP